MRHHTPGPWTIHNDPADGWPMVMAAGRIVANVNPQSCPEHPGPGFVPMPAEANAALIAAAPDLLAALEYVIGCSSPMTEQQKECWPVMRAAIAKATGSGS